MIIRAPGITRPNSICSEPVSSIDFYPTMLELAGITPRREHQLDGVSLVPLLKGQSFAQRPLFWHYPHYGNQGGAPGGAIRDGNWKLIEWYENDELELFNLKEDIGEHDNLVKKWPERAGLLHSKLKTWRESVKAKMPALNPG